MIDKTLLKQQSQRLGILLDDKMLSDFDTYAEMLVETNKQFNLTAITEPDEIVIKHFADSLSLLTIGIKENAKIIDVGTGAGFPAIPLMIARRDIRFTLIDGSGKKLKFVSDVCNKLSLNAEIIHTRAEELGKDTHYREKYDYATARAVSAMRELSEYCIPFVKVGGSFIAMKGIKADEEIKEASNAIKILGGKINTKKEIVLDESASRIIIDVIKISETPTKYPRASAQIAKKPL